MKKLLSLLAVLGCGSAMAAIDISSEIGTFTTSAESYVEAALPAVFVIVGLYFLVRVVKRFTK